MAEVQVEEPSAAAGSVFVRGRRWWRALSWPRRACFLAICVLGSWMLVKAAKMALLIRLVLTHAWPPRRAFDAVEWKSAGGREIDAQGLQAIRREMVEDLLARRELEGRPQAEVRELLGPPDLETPSRDQTGVRWTFFLGVTHSLLGDSEQLTVSFDAAGCFTDAYLYKH